nr:uncharacterized protein LOC117275986 [Nicotiana tomentosiformis]
MSSRRNSRQYNEQEKNDGKWYACGKYGYTQAKCPDLKRKVSRGFNKNKSFGSYSDEDNLEHEEIANLCFMTILENDMNKFSGCWTYEDVYDDDIKEATENCFMARGESSVVRPYECDRCNELQDILDLTLKESQKILNEFRRLNREKKDWKLKLEVCEIERDVILRRSSRIKIATQWNAQIHQSQLCQVFRNKLNEDGKVVRNKAKLAAQGYSQQEGVDYDVTFALVAQLESIRILLAYVSFKGFKLFQMDVKSVFLDGFIDEEVYVKQLPGFGNSQFPYHVYKLTKALYGLKQAPRAWY